MVSLLMLLKVILVSVVNVLFVKLIGIRIVRESIVIGIKILSLLKVKMENLFLR